MEITFEICENDGEKYIKSVMPYDAELDELALKSIAVNHPLFLLPLQRLGVGKPPEFRYAFAEGFVPLNEIEGGLSAIDFFTVAQNLMQAVLNAGDYYLCRENINLTTGHVLINKTSLQLKFVYLPVIDGARGEVDCVKEIIQIIREIKITHGLAIKGRFFELVSEITALNDLPSRFEIIKKEYEATVEDDAAPVDEPIEESVPALEEEQQQMAEEVPAPVDEPNISQISQIGIDITLDETYYSSRTEVLQRPKQVSVSSPVTASANISAPPAQSSSSSATEVMGKPTDATEVLDNKLVAPIGDAFLEFIGKLGGLEKRIFIRPVNNSFTIGRFNGVKKNEKDNDFEFVYNQNTSSISRSHARIDVKAGEYFITDLGSTYGTYINFGREKLLVNKAHPIKHGDSISFSQNGIDYKFVVVGK